MEPTIADITPTEIAPGMAIDGPRTVDDPNAKDRLVFNGRPSMVRVTHLVPRTPPRHDPDREDYNRHTLELHPGLCLVSGELVDAIKRHNPKWDHVGRFVAEIGSPAAFAKLPVDQAVGYVVRSGHEETLRVLRAVEKRPKVIEALDDEIAVLADGPKSKASRDAKREQRRGQRKSGW